MVVAHRNPYVPALPFIRGMQIASEEPHRENDSTRAPVNQDKLMRAGLSRSLGGGFLTFERRCLYTGGAFTFIFYVASTLYLNVPNTPATLTSLDEVRRKEKCARERERYRANRKKRLGQISKWQKANPDKRQKISLKWRMANPEKRRQSVNNWAKNNPEKLLANGMRRRKLELIAGGSWTLQDWEKLKRDHAFRCLSCGRTESELHIAGLILVADHVVPVTSGGRNDFSNRQPLCHGSGGCNNKKYTKHIDYRKNKEN